MGKIFKLYEFLKIFENVEGYKLLEKF